MSQFVKNVSANYGQNILTEIIEPPPDPSSVFWSEETKTNLSIWIPTEA